MIRALAFSLLRNNAVPPPRTIAALVSSGRVKLQSANSGYAFPSVLVSF